MEQFADHCYEIERTEEDIDVQRIWFKTDDKDVNYWAWGSDMVEPVKQTDAPEWNSIMNGA